MHIDTTWKFHEMIAFRDRMAASTGMRLIVHTNQDGLNAGLNPFDHGPNYTRVMKTEDRDVLEHAYEGLRSQVVPDLMPSEESIANVLKIMSYEDPAFASIPPFKHFDLSLVQEIAAGQAKGR